LEVVIIADIVQTANEPIGVVLYGLVGQQVGADIARTGLRL
jgi:hypothetical protein